MKRRSGYIYSFGSYFYPFSLFFNIFFFLQNGAPDWVHDLSSLLSPPYILSPLLSFLFYSLISSFVRFFSFFFFPVFFLSWLVSHVLPLVLSFPFCFSYTFFLRVSFFPFRSRNANLISVNNKNTRFLGRARGVGFYTKLNEKQIRL